MVDPFNKKKLYIDYLIDIVGRGDEYDNLLLHLYATEFYSLVPNDDNRGIDGEQLREKFTDEYGAYAESFSLPSGPCTVLEMLIALAFRVEFDLSGGSYDRSASEWFWVLMGNLGFEIFNNKAYSKQKNVELLEDKLEMLLTREYSFNGYGGIFPLVYTREDQRKIEIWYQMSSWIIENYPI